MTDFDAIRNRIREAHAEALAAVDMAERAANAAEAARSATIADAVATVVAFAPAFADYTHRIDLGIATDPLCDALAALPGAERGVYFYRAGQGNRTRDEVIPRVEVVVAGGLRVECSGEMRPATPEEIAAEYAQDAHVEDLTL